MMENQTKRTAARFCAAVAGLLPAFSMAAVAKTDGAQTLDAKKPDVQAPRVSAPGAVTFTNPIVKGGDAADPWVIYKDGFYYFTATAGGHIYIWKSRTLTGIENGTKAVVWNPGPETPYRWNVWAPELHWLRGKWYIYYTAGERQDKTHRMFVLESVTDDAQGAYVEKGQLKPSDVDTWAIDGTVLQKPDGSLYFLWSGWPSDSGGQQNLYIASMRDPWTLCGPRTLLSAPTLPWEWRINEAPQVLQRNGKIFVIYSGNGAWTERYALGMLTNTNGKVLDPASWKKSPQPVFSSATGLLGSVYSVGHNAFTRSPDGTEDWIVYHGRDTGGDNWAGRKARAQQFTWSLGGTPSFGRPIPSGVPLRVPSGEEKIIAAQQAREAAQQKATQPPAVKPPQATSSEAQKAAAKR